VASRGGYSVRTPETEMKCKYVIVRGADMGSYRYFLSSSLTLVREGSEVNKPLWLTSYGELVFGESIDNIF